MTGIVDIMVLLMLFLILILVILLVVLIFKPVTRNERKINKNIKDIKKQVDQEEY